MSKGLCANVRGLTSPSRQVWIANQLEGKHFALLTEIKNKFILKNGWSTFCSDCDGSGGAAVCLDRRHFSHPTLLHSSRHAVAVEANNIVFIAIYIPCGAAVPDAEYVLSWLPRPPRACVIGGDWNRLATCSAWLQRLEGKGLHVCRNPLPFTRIQPDGRPGATLDRVAASCYVAVPHLQVSGHTDHLLLHVIIGHEGGVRPFPKFVLGDPLFIERMTEMADQYALRAAATNDPVRQCELWEALKRAIVIDAHRYAKKIRRRAGCASQSLQRQFLDPESTPQQRVLYAAQIRQLEDNEVEEVLHRRSVHRLSTWERPCHDFYSLGQERSESFTLPSIPREQMLAQATEFYTRLFQEERPAAREPELLGFVRNIGSHVPDLTFSADTIREALSRCKSNKAPGPDTVPVEVWKSLADRIAVPLARLCNLVCPTCMPRSWREGRITLISKCKEGQMPQSLNDARPITLLNSDYKIFSKALALHLGRYMSQITVAEQRAFIHGRDIRHNIILAESLLYRSPPVDGALLSLDWAKAYDRVSYAYLSRVLQSYKFNQGLTNKIQATMYGFTLSLAAPEGPQPSFPRQRGVGQGCPCAPLLFALAIDPLARALKARLTGIQVSSCPSVFAKVSLCADDTMILVSSKQDVDAARDTLDQYMRASGAMLNWNKSMAVTLGSWRMFPPQFPCPVLDPKHSLRYLGIYLSHKRPASPWEAKLAKINNRLETWKNFHLSLFARANIASTLIASCARYHASCSVPSVKAVRHLQRRLSNFVWSGDPNRKGHRLVTDAAASAPRRSGGLALPNIQAICDAHRLRFWAQAMSSNEDWAWALRADATRTLRAFGLSHPLDNIDKPLHHIGPSFSASIISSLRRCVKQHFHFLQHDLDTLQARDRQLLLNTVPALHEPVEPVAPQNDQQAAADVALPPQRVAARRPIPADKNLFSAVFADPDSSTGLCYASSADGRALMSCSPLGVLTKVQGPLPPADHVDGPAIICRRLFAPPSRPVLFNFGPFESRWSWALLPSPAADRPFAWCSVKDFTLALTKSNGAPAMSHPAWCPGTWFVLRSLPLTKVVSLIWSIGTNRLFLPPRPGATTVCRSCQVPATLDHIIFDCPRSRPLWSSFSHSSGFDIQPNFQSIFAGPDRQHPIAGRFMLVMFQLAFIHIHHVWCSWWAHQHESSRTLERWERRVMNAYLVLVPELQQLWRSVPYTSNIVNSWRF